VSLRSKIEELELTKDVMVQDKKTKDAEIETLNDENFALRADIKEVEATHNKFASVIAAMRTVIPVVKYW
jgi:hypothetical protein